MTGLCDCPKCGGNLRGDEIPASSLHFYGGRATCRDCGQPSHYSNLIGMYDRNADRTTAWHCPLCGETWPT